MNKKTRNIAIILACATLFSGELTFAIKTSKEPVNSKTTNKYQEYLLNHDYKLKGIGETVYSPSLAGSFHEYVTNAQIFDYQTEINLLKIYIDDMDNKALKGKCLIFMDYLYKYLEAVQANDQVTSENIIEMLNNTRDKMNINNFLSEKEKGMYEMFWYNYNRILWNIYDAYSKNIKKFNLKISF